ncbi:MAG TPA: hypothetical protein VIJ64_11075 [Candidatus Lustribacter sp.]
MAAPQNAAQINSAEQAPQNAQLAAQASFAAQVHKREETVAETDHAKGTHIRTNADADGNGGYTPQGGRQGAHREPQDSPEIGLAGDGEHLIDFTA